MLEMFQFLAVAVPIVYFNLDLLFFQILIFVSFLERGREGGKESVPERVRERERGRERELKK